MANDTMTYFVEGLWLKVDGPPHHFGGYEAEREKASTKCGGEVGLQSG
jgi:hypothetical protein